MGKWRNSDRAGEQGALHKLLSKGNMQLTNKKRLIFSEKQNTKGNNRPV